VNEEKNAAKGQAIQIKSSQTSPDKERRLFRKKAIQLDEEALISRKFYKRLNDVGRAKNGELLTNKNQVRASWKEHFEEHLNECSESEQLTLPVDLRDDGVDIDLLSDKLDCNNYQGLLNVTSHKIFANILYDLLLLHANAAAQHYQAEFQSGKSTIDQLFALPQILENALSLTSQCIIYS
jgi:hypothetical protein